MITLTKAHIEQLKTPQGGFNMETMEIVGCWPLFAGWQEHLVGKKVSDRNWQKAMKARLRERHIFRGSTRKHTR